MGDRLTAVREALKREGMDAIALVPGPSLRYVTGHPFEPSERLVLLVVPADGPPVVVLPNLEEHTWREAAPFEALVVTWDDTEGPGRAVDRASRELGPLGAIAVEPLVMRVMEFEYVQRLSPNGRTMDGSAIIQQLRRIKGGEELAAMREAVGIAENALTDLLCEIRPGAQERHLAAKLSSALLALGGEGISFGPIVLSGPKSAFPHGVPDERAIQPGELLLLDFGTSVRGYHCDITRTFVVGAQPDDRIRQVYDAVLHGNETARKVAEPGKTSGEVHDAAQGHFAAPDYERFFKHRTGHGLGLDVHEPPAILAGGNTVLEPGMVFTIEPGLYLEGWGGVRIEDDVLVTADGAASLTTYPRELQVIGETV